MFACLAIMTAAAFAGNGTHKKAVKKQPVQTTSASPAPVKSEAKTETPKKATAVKTVPGKRVVKNSHSNNQVKPKN